RGSSLRDAAAEANVSERSARRFAKDPTFLATLATLRRDLIEGLRDELLLSAREALEKMRALMGSTDERVVLIAAKEILNHALPAKLEVNMRPTDSPRGLPSDDELDELLTRLGNSGLLREPGDQEAYQRYVEAMAEAEKDPARTIVPATFMPQSEERS